MKFSILLIVLLLFNCKNQNSIRPDSQRKIGFDSIVPIKEVNQCTFDTSSYKFTTKAISKALPNKSFKWDKKNKQVIVPFKNGDSLTLAIGGCHHFSYLATYHTDSIKFYDSDFLLNKTLWMVENFFDGQIKDGFAKALNNKTFSLYEEQEPYFKPYEVKETGASENHIFEGFFFTLENGRTMIWINGYINQKSVGVNIAYS